MVEQIKLTEIPHHVLGKFVGDTDIEGTQIGQDRMLIRPAGSTCQIGPKGLADRRIKVDDNWRAPLTRIDDETLLVIDGYGNYNEGSQIYAAAIRDDGDVPSDLISGGNGNTDGLFQWNDKPYTPGAPGYMNYTWIPPVPKYGFEKIFDELWLPEYWQSVPSSVSISCSVTDRRFWRDPNSLNTIYWVGSVDGRDFQYYPNWYSYGANYLFRFFLDENNNITPDSSFHVQLGDFWEGFSGGSAQIWGPGEAGALTNNLFWVRARWVENQTYANHKDSIRVYDYSGNLVDETPGLYPQTSEYNGDPDYEYGYAIARQGSDGDIAVALQRAHSHQSPPEYMYSGYMIETWLEIERWSWNGSALVKTKSVSLDYSYAGDDSYFWSFEEWKPGSWAVVPDKCLKPPIPYGAPGYGTTNELARELRLLITDNDFNITHSYTVPTLSNRSDVTSNEDERLHWTAWGSGVVSPMITREGNGIWGWQWYDEWGDDALYDPIPQLYHFSLFDTGTQIIDPVWGKHAEVLSWGQPTLAYPDRDARVVQSIGKDPWNDDSPLTYTEGPIWTDYYYNAIHYATLRVPENRSMLDVVGFKLSITVQNTAPSKIHWQWYLQDTPDYQIDGNVSFGDYGVPLEANETFTYTQIYNEHIFRNVDYDGVYWPRKQVPDPSDVYGYGWTLPDGPYNGYSGSWGGEWGGYAPSTFAKMKHMLIKYGFGLEISPDTGYDDEDPEFDFTRYHLRVLNVKLEVITGNQPPQASHINKAADGGAPNWVNVCPVEGVTSVYPVTVHKAGTYATVVGTGSQWYDGSDDTYTVVGATPAGKSRLEVQLPAIPPITSLSGVTLHLRAEANNANSSGTQLIIDLYDKPWDDPATIWLGAFRLGSTSYAFVPEGGIQNLVCTVLYGDSAIYAALMAGGAYMYVYGSTAGAVDYWAKIYEAQVYVDGVPVAPEVTGASGADNKLNIGDDAAQDWRPMHFNWTGGGFNKWQPVRFNKSTDGGQDWTVACPHAYGWE